MRHLHIATAEEGEKELIRIGVDPYGIEAMVPKMEKFNLLLEDIECKVANILKQEALSVGGDVAVARGVVDCSVERTDALIIGNVKQMRALAKKLSIQPFGLRKIAEDIGTVLNDLARHSFQLTTPRRTMEIGSKTLVMGILNVTPDSFSDGGRFEDTEAAIEFGAAMEEAGADIIDVGGESTRPGSAPVSQEEELQRVIPVIRVLAGRLAVPISIDTRKAKVAEEALKAGAEIVNDVSALTFDEEMKSVVAHHGVPVVLMHMRGTPLTMQEGSLSYRSLRGDIICFLEKRIADAERAGIHGEQIIIDPGLGFGKSLEDNLRIIKYLSEFKVLGRPIMVGVSRKRFIGGVTGGEPKDRLEGAAAAVTGAIMQGAHIVRVHDVRFMKRVSVMVDALMRC